MSKTKAAATAASSQVLILYGLDQEGKPHAGKFSISQKGAAAKAAEAMGFKVHEAEAASLAEILQKLPAGRLYSNGRGFVPFVRRDRFTKLMEALGLPDSSGESSAGGMPVVAQGLPTDWDSISAGHLVIAHDGHEGWYEFIVIDVEGDMLTLRFRDYPKEPRITRHRAAVVLFNPAPPRDVISKTA